MRYATIWTGTLRTGTLLCGAWLLSWSLLAVTAADKPAGKVTLQPADWKQAQALVAKHKGKIVVLDVWSTSCDPCMKEFPNLVKLHQQHGQDVACLSLSTDFAGIKNKPPEFYKARVLKFLEEQKATFDNLLCTTPADELFEELDLASIPAVYVYGRDGKLVKRFDGGDGENVGTDEEAFTYADVNKVVNELLQKKK